MHLLKFLCYVYLFKFIFTCSSVKIEMWKRIHGLLVMIGLIGTGVGREMINYITYCESSFLLFAILLTAWHIRIHIRVTIKLLQNKVIGIKLCKQSCFQFILGLTRVNNNLPDGLELSYGNQNILLLIQFWKDQKWQKFSGSLVTVFFINEL